MSKPAQPDRPLHRPREPDTVCTIPGPCPCEWPCKIAADNLAKLPEIREFLAKAYAGGAS
jgi:hypothetical protein